MKRLAAAVLGATPDDIELAEGFARLRENAEVALPFMALGAIINANNAGLPADLDVTLNCRYVYRPQFQVPDKERKFGNLTLTYASQIHACVVEVDPETGVYEIVAYGAVDDCGTRINPRIVDGQVHGATAQALGAATWETFPYDEDGNLLTPNFYDYHVPHALDMPPLKDELHRVAVAVHAARREGHGRGRRRRHPRGLRRAPGRAARARGPARHGQPQPVPPGLADARGSRGDAPRSGGANEMKVEGTRSFAAPRETVWEVLNDPVRMAELMPGVERFDVHDDRHWVAQVKIPLGLGGLRMSINFDKLEERSPEYARLHAKGNGVGALMDMETQFHLEEVGGGTNMRWEADVKIAGPVGSMGQRVLQPIVNQQVSMVLNALDRSVQSASTGLCAGGLLRRGERRRCARLARRGAGRAGGHGRRRGGGQPLSPEAYDEDPQGPTTSTEDRP